MKKGFNINIEKTDDVFWTFLIKATFFQHERVAKFLRPKRVNSEH